MHMNELIIDKDDLLFNINEVKKKVGTDDYTIIAVVKGNGYGLDIVKLTNFLAENGIHFFAVASVDEALKLRQAGVQEKIMILTPFTESKIVKQLIDNDIVLTIDSAESAKVANEIAKEENKKITAHIKIDTGLSRFGFDYTDNETTARVIRYSDSINFEGIYSHFSNSLAKDDSWSREQYSRFCKTIVYLENQGFTFNLKHICNSSGFFKYPDMHLNCARIGSAFCGLATGTSSNLKKIGTFHTKIIRMRELKKGDFIGYGNSYTVKKKKLKIGILPTGYFDGIGKTLESQRFKFLSKFKRCLVDFKNSFKDDSLLLNIKGKKIKILGQIGMHDVVIELPKKDFNENDDVYFSVRPVFIDSSITRVYK